MVAVDESPALHGLVLVGSLVTGDIDPLSDVDALVIARDGRFEEAWAARNGLEGGESVVSWDRRSPEMAEAGAHKWMTNDLVLMDCLLATATSGVRLAEPFEVLVGPADLATRIPSRPPIARGEMALTGHPIEDAYDELKMAIRRARAG